MSTTDHTLGLTDEQSAVVLHETGHARVAAVAGSGKTHTMVRRTLRLVDSGVDPRRCLVVMFNKSAADDFAERLKHNAQGRTNLPETRTFHSLGFKITDRFVAEGALPAAKLITEEAQIGPRRRAALRDAASEAGVKAQIDADNSAQEEFTRFIDIVKAGLDAPYVVFGREGLSQDYQCFIRGFEIFEEMRLDQGFRTYADLIYDPVRLIHRDPKAAHRIANHLDHITIDEYQDINEAQQVMMKTIAGHRASVMVIGDVDQVVYAFRGAQPRFIQHDFAKDFPAYTNYQLTRTFRYGHALSLTANAAIQNNRERDDKICISAPGTPNTKVVMRAETTSSLPIVERWCNAGRELSECAVLSRLFAALGGIELELLDAGIPYRLVGGDSILESPMTHAILGYFHLCAGTLDQHIRKPSYVHAMLSQPPVGMTRDELPALGKKVAERPNDGALLINQASQTASPWISRKLAERARLFQRFRRLPSSTNAADAISIFLSESGLEEFWDRVANAETADERRKTIDILSGFARAGQLTIEGFIARLAALEEALNHMDATGDAVMMTSIHRAKGREWPLVVIPGIEDGAFPYLGRTQPHKMRERMEDERRLWYVGITRAKEHLFLLHPDDPSLVPALTGQAEQPRNPTASRFLYESNPLLARDVSDSIHDGVPSLPASPDAQLIKRYFDAIGLHAENAA